MVRTWFYTFDPDTNQIIEQAPHSPMVTFISQNQTCLHAYYPTTSQPSNLNPTQYPITHETQCNGFWITLPVLPIPPIPHAPVITTTGSTLRRIQSKLPSYAPELWTSIDPAPNQSVLTLQQYLTAATGSLLVVSDASLNSQQQSAFSWVISTTTQVLWTGGGTVPGSQRDVHSGRAEGFGLLAAFSFLEQYLSHLPATPLASPPQIEGYCNNSGLIQQVTKMLTNHIPNPSWAIAYDYDLHNEIFQTIRRIPLPVSLHHVKGHQDQNTPVQDLPYEAQLNIDCDKQARINLASFPINLRSNPNLPASYPHLRIRSQTVVRQIPEYIREHNLLPTYHKYLANKFNWPADLHTQIEWQIIDPAMQHLQPNDRVRIRKIIHEWIPTRVSPGNNPSQEVDQLCPTCNRVQETPEHFIHCTNPTRIALRQKLRMQFTTLCTELQLDPHWYQLWWMGLTQPNDPDAHDINLYPPMFHPIHLSQQQIGWQQLYYG